MDHATNRHPVDDLADVRGKIAALKEREQEIRNLLIGAKSKGDLKTLRGDEFEAAIHVQRSERLDSAAVKKEFGTERLRKFLLASEMTVVKLRKI